jgi:hypothetical protein
VGVVYEIGDLDDVGKLDRMYAGARSFQAVA